MEILFIVLIVGAACYAMWRNVRRRMKSGCCGGCAKSSICGGIPAVDTEKCKEKEGDSSG